MYSDNPYFYNETLNYFSSYGISNKYNTYKI